MIFTLLYAFCLIVPGWALLTLLRAGSPGHWFMLPIASLGIFLGLNAGFSLLTLPFDWFSYAYFFVVLVLLGLVAGRRMLQGSDLSASIIAS